MSSQYGTIDIFLENTSNLNKDLKYDYVATTSTGPYTGFAQSDGVDNELVLVDNSFTLPDNPPPFQIGSQITIIDSQNGETVLTTKIVNIINHGNKSVFKFDLTYDELETDDNEFTVQEEFVVQNEVEGEQVEEKEEFTEVQTGVYTRFGDSNFYYEDGQIIQRPPLPASYQISDNQNKCLNCSFYIEAASYCSKWKADIRQNYWCASWDGIQTENKETMELYSDSDNNTMTQLYPKFTENVAADVASDEIHSYETNTFNDTIVDNSTSADDIPLEPLVPDVPEEPDVPDVPPGWNEEPDTPPIDDETDPADIESDFYVSPDIEDVGGQVDFFPTGSDGAVIIPDEKTIKRVIREKVYEGMYSAVINSDLTPQDIISFQQTIRDGALAVGRGDDEILVYTKKDGNVLNQPGDKIEDVVTQIYNDGEEIWANSTNMNYIQTQIEGLNITYPINITATQKTYTVKFASSEAKMYAQANDDMGIWYWTNVPNIPNIDWVGEFGNTIDIQKAQENLDTNIYELLPFQRSRQNEIDELFTKLTATNFLGEVPQFDSDGSITGQELANDSGSRISENDNLSAAITRLDNQTNIANENKSLQSLRNTLNLYLKDVDNAVDEIDDTRPEYNNKSEGYLKLRKPNQAIIIRNPDGGELDFQKNDSYLTDGFTITMWVRFVGRTGHGTLFSYGNPYKEDVQSRYGFRLETFTVSRKDRYPDYPESVNSSTYITPPNDYPVDPPPFEYSDYERFVRLVVWDHTDTESYADGALLNDDGTYGKLYDSHFATPRKPRQILYNPKVSSQGTVRGEGSGGRSSVLPVYFPPSEYGNQGQSNSMHEFAFNYTRVPTDDLDEWFFICATYDPEVDRDVEDRAKVEIISRRDLLTARGFKVEESESGVTKEDPIDDFNPKDSYFDKEVDTEDSLKDTEDIR